jgi:hypothetical protein
MGVFASLVKTQVEMRARINIFLAIALIAPLIMVGLNLYPSWSQYAKSSYEFLLDATLICISLVFMDTWWNKPNRLDYIIALGFLGILLTDVTQPALEIPHFIVTGGSAALVAYRMITYYPKGMMRLGNVVGASIGALGFAAGFFTEWYSTGVGEWIFAFVAAVHIFVINNKLDQ